jgi:glycosyltransferase involved in cell wall biosynthesis
MSRLVSIGIPVKNEEANLPKLINRLSKVVLELEARSYEVEIIINNNFSTDNSGAILQNWADLDSRVVLNNLSAPLSFQESIQQLMQKAKGDCFALLQSDLQDPPEMILEMLQPWEQGSSVVAGIIVERSEGFFQNKIRNVFYHLLNSVSDDPLLSGFQDFYLLDKKVVEKLSKLPSEGLFLRGHIASRFGAVSLLHYRRSNRSAGESNFNFGAKYSLALNGLLLFGTGFVRRVSTLSFLLFILGIFGIFLELGLYLAGYRAPVQGWASLGILLMLLVSILGMGTGLILEYLIRIYRLLIFNHR